MSELRRIDLNDFVKSGEGANGSSFNMAGNPDIMVKLYDEGYPTGTIFTEHEIARKAYDLGIPSPEPGEIVTDGSRIGILFRRIRGKRSFSRILADEPRRVDEMAREFAGFCKKLHTFECPDGLFPEAKSQFHHLLDEDRTFTPEQKQVIADCIDHTPDCTNAIHGDMHMGNVVSTLPAGASLSVPHELYFIDMGYFARGCPLFDMGMLQMICLYASEDFRMHDFHISGELAKDFWMSFVDEYFFGPERLGRKWFGENATHDSVNDGIRPYCALKMLLVEYNLGGYMLPHYLKFINDVFGF